MLAQLISEVRPYIEQLESTLEDVRKSARWGPQTPAWYRATNNRSARSLKAPRVPAIVVANIGMRVRVRVPAIGGPRTTNVSPSSLAQVASVDVDEWQRLAELSGIA